MPTGKPGTTIVVPVRHEEGSVGPLLQRLDTSSRRLGRTEVLFVDDSDNHHTGDAIRQGVHALRSGRLLVRHIHRQGNDRWGGLSGAVVDGFREASAPVVLVMDGDGQHPPETVPDVIDKIRAGADIVVASRYRDGGNSKGLDGIKRQLVSRAATVLTRTLFPRGMRGITDPMTGFFAFQRDRVDLKQLASARGYKILMELLVSHPELTRNEVPLEFQVRIDGESKSGEGNGAEFIRQLVRLRLKTMPTIVNFMFGGGLIALLGMLMLAGMVALGVNPLAANAVQMVVTLALNFVYNRNVTWRGKHNRRLRYQMFHYLWTRGSTQALGWCAFVGLMTVGAHMHILGTSWRSQVANIIATFAVMVLNYMTSKYVVFTAAKLAPQHRSHRTIATGQKGRTIVVAGVLTAFTGVQLLVIGLVGFSTWFLGLILLYAGFSLLTSAMELGWRLYSHSTPDAEKAMGFEPPVTVDTAQHTFSIIIPALHEEAVIGATLQRALDQTHPDVQIVVSLVDGDDATLAAVQQVAANYPPERITIVSRSYENGSKPQQLNEALKYCTGEFVGILDAETLAHHDLVAAAEATLVARGARMIQCGVLLTNLDLPSPTTWDRLPNHPRLHKMLAWFFLSAVWTYIRGWFCVHNVMEYWSWFSSRVFWQLLKGVMPYGGNSLFRETESLRAKGGWPRTLTEDCSLGISDSAEGVIKMTAAFDPELASREQTPGRVFGPGGLIKQRTRWDQGFWEELLHGEWRKLTTLGQRLNALYILGMPLIQAINGLFVPLALVGVMVLVTRASLVLAMFLPFIPMTLTLITQLLGLREFSRKMGVKTRPRHYMSLAFLSPVYQILLAWPAIKGIGRWIAGLTNWDKTSHTGELMNLEVIARPDAEATPELVTA